MKKVLVFSPYYPPHVGGLESHADEFNKYLSVLGWKIRVLTPRLPETALVKENLHTGVEVWRYPAWEIIPNFPLPKFWRKDFWDMWKDVSLDDYNWVISRTRFFMSSFWAGCYAKRKKIKWLHVEHGSDYVKLNSRFKNIVSRVVDHSMGKWILKNADKVVANSKATAKFCRKLYSGGKYEVIYRGVELSYFSEDKKLRDKYSSMVVISYVGRLIDGKGVADLVEAVSRFERSDWVLWIIGEGPRRLDLERLSKEKGLGEKVVFFGQVEKKKLLGMLSVSDIFVNPSYTEGLPTSVIEAAWCGNAIVATDVGGTREIVDDGVSGVLVPAKDIKRLSLEIRDFLHDSQKRKSFGKKAKIKVGDTFSWEESIKKYVEILG